MSENKQLQHAEHDGHMGAVHPSPVACRKLLLRLATMTTFDVTKGA